MDALLSMQGVLAAEAAAYVGTKAAQLDGVDEYLTCGTPTLNNLGFSVSFWARRDGGAGTRYLVSRRTTNARNWYLAVTSSNVVATWNQTASLSATAAQPDGDWFHVVASFDDPADHRIRLWVDGALADEQTSAALTTATVTGTVNIGYLPTIGGYLAGAICDVALWNVAFSDAEVLAMYNGGVRGDPEALSGQTAVALWAFQASDDMTGTTGSIADLKGGTAATPFNTESGDLVAGP